MSDAAEFVLGAPAPPEEPEPEEESGPPSRDRDLLAGQNKKRDDELAKLFDDIARGFEDQKDRADDNERYWDCYNCIINECQYYHGIAEIAFPIIHDAIEARATRFTNQLFPPGGRAIEQTSDGRQHAGLLGLLEHYLRESLFETRVAQPLCRHGDIEGHYHLYMDWGEIERQVVSCETHGPRVPVGDQMVEAPGEEIEDIKEETIIEGRPVFEVLHDCDVLVLPATSDSIDEALANGGSVTIARRWTKTKIDQMIDQDQIQKKPGKALKDAMAAIQAGAPNQEKRLLEHVGIRAKGSEATVWETWKLLPLDDRGVYAEKGRPRLCRIFFGPEKEALGAKRNPNWNDRCPLLSEPVEKVAGVFKGKSKIAHVASLQYEANDAVNEGADAATLSAVPIIRYDPDESPGPKVLAIGALWPGKRGSVEFMQFPDLTPRAVTRVQMAMQAIFQSLGVNPSMLPQQTRVGKPNQAQVAQEQAVDLLTTAQGVKVQSQGIYTPMLGWMVDLDYQFRDTEITVRAFGQMGREAQLEQVAPLQNRAGFSFQWRGAEQVKMMAMMQQNGTAFLNIARTFRQELMAEGMQVRFAPMLESAAQSIFGAVLGSQILIDQRHQLTMPQAEENVLLGEGFEMPVHPLDNDVEHLKELVPWIQQTGDTHGTGRAHAQGHIQSMQMKNAASMMRQQAAQGGGASGARPQGGPGQPQPGATPGQPHAAKGPPGAMHPDRGPMSGVVAMPRRN